MQRQHPRRECGAAAVEFALVLVPLLLILLGTIDWGYYFFVRAVAGNAAREGARAGAIAHDSGQVVAGNYLRTQLGSGAACGVGACTASSTPACVSAAECCCVQVDCTIGATGSLSGFLPAGTIPAAVQTQSAMRFE
jgi:Flp pilus assembly protein TadG